jgi:hypothetical protein
MVSYLVCTFCMFVAYMTVLRSKSDTAIQILLVCVIAFVGYSFLQLPKVEFYELSKIFARFVL